MALNEPLDAALLDIYLIDQIVEPIADVLARRGIPFAFVTAHSRALLPAAHRARPYVDKPFTDGEIRTAVATLIARP